jgi:UDP:flavonoid glycosyltransferase YjiC (YdhE family)
VTPAGEGLGICLSSGDVVRALLTCFPFTGHLNPVLSLGRAMRTAGHEVRVATDPVAEPMVRSAGLDILPIDLAVPPLPEVLHSREQLTEGWWQPYQLFEGGLRDAVADWPADVIVRDSHVEPAFTVAADAGIPSVALATMVGPPLRGEELRLCPYPPSLAAPETPPAGNERYLRPLLDDFAGNPTLPSWIAERRAEPLVYATIGTLLNRTASVLPTIIEGLADLDVQVLVTIGRDRTTLGRQPLPDNVRIEQYVPHNLLLPHCAAVVTHSGFSTMLGALTYGVPLCIVPLSCEDAFNAERCAALGAGLYHPAPGGGAELLEFDGVDPSVVRQMVRTVLSDSAYARSAQRIRQEIERLPDQADAVRLVEEYVGNLARDAAETAR